MGMFDNFAGAAIGALSGFLGGQSANKASQQSAREQMVFQEDMANTSYQRAVADLNAAGLSPMLAYSKGGAAVPTGSSYKAERGMVNDLTKEIGELTTDEAGKLIAAPSRFGKIVGALDKVRPYIFSASEGFEEGSQYAIQVGTQDYYNKKNNNQPTSFLDSLSEGITQTLGTNEGMENVLRFSNKFTSSINCGALNFLYSRIDYTLLHSCRRS